MRQQEALMIGETERALLPMALLRRPWLWLVLRVHRLLVLRLVARPRRLAY